MAAGGRAARPRPSFLPSSAAGSAARLRIKILLPFDQMTDRDCASARKCAHGKKNSSTEIQGHGRSIRNFSCSSSSQIHNHKVQVNPTSTCCIHVGGAAIYCIRFAILQLVFIATGVVQNDSLSLASIFSVPNPTDYGQWAAQLARQPIPSLRLPSLRRPHTYPPPIDRYF